MRLFDASEFDRVLRALGGDVDSFCEIVDLFLADLPVQQSRLSTHWFASDETLSGVLHELGSACGAVGAAEAERAIRAAEWRLEQKETLTAAELDFLLQKITSSKEDLARFIAAARQRL